MKKLPIGIQTYKKIINSNYYYVDKTSFIKKLHDEGEYYFLSRPRRFGKSLFLSTLKAAFSGEKQLFQGYFLEHNWDWDIKRPVIHISFGAGVSRSVEEIRITFDEILYDHARENSIRFVKKSLKGKFAELISSLYEKYGRQVVVLIDEYDKPILDNIHETETAILIREELKNIYSVIKDADPYLKFVFITGVSKFSKVSLFSWLNNLEDIALAKEYSAICGYTQKELETVFAENHGQIDLTVHFDDRIYLIEFKVVELTEKGSAMKQIRDKKYHQKYSNKNVYLIGIEFSRNDRNIANFEWELIKPSEQI